MDLTSDIDAVAAFLDELVAAVRMDLPGADQSLGRDLAAAVAAGIQVRTEQEKRDASGGPLRPNAPKYAARKERDYAVVANQPAVRTGQTLSLQSLVGRTEVSADAVTMVYGINAPPSRTRSGGWRRAALRDQDRKVTDVQKAGYLEAQGRPFFGLDEATADACREVAREAVARLLAQDRP